ncbi:secretory phospholipase A2 receptor-like [Acanthaster planci]|uniref:Secretory phospholipase A2 receptor-like n=1 Tax=Acanthaster planci TaxID=133434 RepID=A0A8B7YJ43_ACAPL|nr:secretory phospholipase A2 receptor-like [Acanthaster planci]
MIQNVVASGFQLDRGEWIGCQDDNVISDLWCSAGSQKMDFAPTGSDQNIQIGTERKLAEAGFSTATSCPPGWKKWNRSCFAVNIERMSWMEASDFCESKGSRLAVPNSQAENDFIWQTAVEQFQAESTRRNGVWIGCKKESANSSFMCSGGREKIGFTNWEADSPGHEFPQCVVYFKRGNGKWTSNDCDPKGGKFAACEMSTPPGMHCLTANASGRFVSDL